MKVINITIILNWSLLSLVMRYIMMYGAVLTVTLYNSKSIQSCFKSSRPWIELLLLNFCFKVYKRSTSYKNATHFILAMIFWFCDIWKLIERNVLSHTLRSEKCFNVTLRFYCFVFNKYCCVLQGFRDRELE